MTILPSKETRDLIGINSFERAILWSACSLLSVINLQSSNYDKNYSLVIDRENSQILINFGMPLNMGLFWSSMGDPYLALKEITNLTPTYDAEYLPVSNVLEHEPTSVNTLEKFFVWANKKLLEFYLINEPSKQKEIMLTTEIKYSSLFVTTNLNYNPVIYNESDNLLKAVLITSTVENNSSLVGNNVLFGNNYLVGN